MDEQERKEGGWLGLLHCDVHVHFSSHGVYMLQHLREGTAAVDDWIDELGSIAEPMEILACACMGNVRVLRKGLNEEEEKRIPERMMVVALRS